MASSKEGRSSKFYVFGVGALVIAVGAVVYFHVTRNQNVASAREARAVVSDRGPRVEFVTATAGPTERTIRLLGDVRSGATAVLYAKVAGYIKEVQVDKGDKVEAGQILAEIELPEVEQQFAAASADLVHKRRNLARIKELYSKGNTTQVAMYQAETDATVAENNVGVLGDVGVVQDRARAVRRPGDRALRRSGRAGHQLADQHHQRHADDDALGRQPDPRLHLCAADGRAVCAGRQPRRGQRCRQSGAQQGRDGDPDDRRARAAHAHHAHRGPSRQCGRLLHARQLRLCDAARSDQELHPDSGRRA